MTTRDTPLMDDHEPGEWKRLLEDEDLRTPLAEASAEMLDKGLIDELGSLRVVLLRVMKDEPGSEQLVSKVTRIVSTTAQAVKVQNAIRRKEHHAESQQEMQRVTSFLRDLLGDPPDQQEVAPATKPDPKKTGEDPS